MSKQPISKHAGPLRRRTFLKACGAAGVGLAWPGLGGCGGAAPGGADGGADDAFPVPPLLEGELVDGVRVFHLTLQPGTMDWGLDAVTATYGVNGAFLGPTLRFRRGERVRIEVENSLEETTTLHWHGMHLPARSDGGPYQTIAAGTTWITEYDVTQRAMTAWYHPHQMHLTGRHVAMGMAGLIVVEDEAAQVDLPSTYGLDDLPLVIQDRRFSADGTHPYSPGRTLAQFDMMAGLKGDTLLVNGVVHPRGVVAQGLVRLRFLNGSNARNYNLGFADDRSFLHIASDGGLLEAPVATTRVLVGPGERVELLVDFTADATGAAVPLLSYSGEVFAELFSGQMGSVIGDELDQSSFELATLVVGVPLGASITPPASFEPITRLTESAAARTRQLTLAMGQGGVSINGVRMTELGAVPGAINFTIPRGDIELWQVTNTSGMSHPLHIHNRQFQILDVDAQPPQPSLAGWKDTVLVRPGQIIRLLLTFDGAADPEFPYMFHCHILEHEDMGMMGQFYLVDR